MAFSNGATLVVGRKETPKFGNDLARFLREAGITYLSTVPTMLSTMTEDIPCLRQLVVSGEACPPELVARWARDGRTMLNVYGPTEATVNTTAVALQPGRPVTIGSPLDGYSTLILDEQMQPVPRGSKGELYVGGPGVSRGYLNQPELTARAFHPGWRPPPLPHRRSRAPQRRRRARVLRPHRRPGEDPRLPRGARARSKRCCWSSRRSPAPRSACGSARACLRSRLMWFCTATPATSTAAPLSRPCARACRPTWCRRISMCSSALPMLASGKVDRKALPEPQIAARARRRRRPRARNACWSSRSRPAGPRLFKLPRVGAEQDFFLDLGGHSLLAAHLVAAAARHALRSASPSATSMPTQPCASSPRTSTRCARRQAR